MSMTDTDSALLQRIAAQVAQPAPAQASEKNKVITPEESAVEKTWGFTGFGPKSRVLTSFGYVPMEALRRRDPIKTFEGRFLEVQYVDEVRLDRRYLIDHPEAQPILLPRHSLSATAPAVEMFVSGAQRLRSVDRTSNNLAVKAEDMIGRSGIMRKSHGYFTYYHFHCGEPCTVQIDGVWCEIASPSAEAVH